MASSSAVNASNMLRITGLASGLDTESIVSSLMKVEQTKFDKLYKKKVQMDWRKDAQLGVNNLLREFRDKYLSVASKESNILSSSSFLAYKVTMDSSLSAKVTASKSALTGAHTINSITSIAAGANAASADTVSDASLSTDTELGALALKTPLAFSSGEMSFRINGQTFTFSSGDSLQTVLNRVNADTKANVTMTYSSLTNKFSIKSDNLGSDSSLVVENLSGNAFDPAGAAFGINAGTYTNGTDAVLSIDGISVTKDTNNFTIDGINYKLTGTSASAQQFSVEQDVDSTVKKVTDFIDAYNTLIEKLDGILTEERNADYEPLTDEEKAGMSASQIEQWEKSAKSGLLKNDSYIKNLLSDLRKSFYQKVEEAGISANAVGLGTMSYLTKGAIMVDESKLRTALENNPEQVLSLFTETSASTDKAIAYAQSGLATRIKDSINGYINDATGYRQSSFNDEYDRITDNMDRMQDILTQKEQRYWNQYTALETALAKMNSQSEWLGQQLSALSK